ncbi:MAG TPA: hypothetical protein VF044_11020, partial [Actinomycetota bacterium]
MNQSDADDRRCRLVAALVGVMAVSAAGPLRAGDGPNVCSATARAAFRACQHEARDDYWIAVGGCKNESDADERAECKADAETERDEVLNEECPDQKEARLDLCDALGEGPYDPEIDPASFLSPAETAADPNPWLPLVVGSVWRYEGGDETIIVTVTDRTKEILGVTTIVVRDVVEEDGEPVEDTDDYFAQDRDGNVWYFGELSKNFEDGELVDIEGSWTAGVELAKAGIVMKADPMVGDVYRQEFLLGEAEDVGEVTAIDGSESVPAASCDGTCVVTRDTTPLEPDVAEAKYYAPGVGL